MTAAPAFSTVAAGRAAQRPHGLCAVCRHFDATFEGGRAGVCRNPNARMHGFSVGRAHGCADHHPKGDA